MEREHTRVHEENKTEASKVQWVLWVQPDGPDDVGGPVRQRWGQLDEDGDGWTKMGTNPDSTFLFDPVLIVPALSYCFAIVLLFENLYSLPSSNSQALAPSGLSL